MSVYRKYILVLEYIFYKYKKRIIYGQKKTNKRTV